MDLFKKSPADPWREKIASATTGARRIAVCGIGNDRRGDDAAGVLSLRLLERRMRGGRPEGRAVLLVDGGDTPESETSRIRAFGPDLVVLIDAARGGRFPGDISVVDKEKIADDEVSTHRISLSLLVRFIEESIGAPVLFLGIEPQSTNPGAPVSRVVRKAAQSVAKAVFRLISE